MMISEAELKRIALLARLELKSEELAAYPTQFAAILEHFEKISQIKTEGIEPLISPSEMEQHLREDQVTPWEGAELAMANAPEKSGNLFKVPPVV